MTFQKTVTSALFAAVYACLLTMILSNTPRFDLLVLAAVCAVAAGFLAFEVSDDERRLSKLESQVFTAHRMTLEAFAANIAEAQKKADEAVALAKKATFAQGMGR